MTRHRGRRAGLLLAGLLSGCAVGGAAPWPSGTTERPAAAIDAPLATSVWPAEGGEPRALILAVHGYGDHADSVFAEAAAFWSAGGIETRAYDQRGFGRNPSHGSWPGADRLIADFAAQVEAAAAVRPNVPLIAVGHSMGGGVALAAIGEGRAPQVDALLLAAPAVAGGGRVGLAARAGLWAAAAVAPDRRWTGEGLVRFQASDDIAMLRRLAADPLYIGAPSARELVGLVRIMDRAVTAAPEAAIPSLVLIGAKDELVAVADIRAVAETLGGPVETRLYPEGWHMLFRDRQKTRIWRDVRDWALAQALR